jgi:hypothetical protein
MAKFFGECPLKRSWAMLLLGGDGDLSLVQELEYLARDRGLLSVRGLGARVEGDRSPEVGPGDLSGVGRGGGVEDLAGLLAAGLVLGRSVVAEGGAESPGQGGALAGTALAGEGQLLLAETVV